MVVGDHDYKISDSADFTHFIMLVTDHPDFNPSTLDNDVSILTLRKAIVISDTARPACLPREGTSNRYEGIDAIVSGWGFTEHVRVRKARFILPQVFAS